MMKDVNFQTNLLAIWFLSTFPGVLEKLRKATIRFNIFVCPTAWNSLVPDGRIFEKKKLFFNFRKLSRKFTFHSNMMRMTGTLHEGRYKFLVSFT
jgi:hypothetical protein